MCTVIHALNSQHFHYLVILLYRPLASAPSGAPTTEKLGLDTVGSPSFLRHLLRSAAGSCLDNAIRIAQILRYHRQCCDARLSSVMALDHARVAAATLLSAIEPDLKASHRNVLVEYLNTILEALREVSAMFEPAARMLNELELILNGRSWNLDARVSPISRSNWSTATRTGTASERRDSHVSTDASTSKYGFAALDNRQSPSTKSDPIGHLEPSGSSDGSSTTSQYCDPLWGQPMFTSSFMSNQENPSGDIPSKDPGVWDTTASPGTGFDAILFDPRSGCPRSHGETMATSVSEEATPLWALDAPHESSVFCQIVHS